MSIWVMINLETWKWTIIWFLNGSYSVIKSFFRIDRSRGAALYFFLRRGKWKKDTSMSHRPWILWLRRFLVCLRWRWLLFADWVNNPGVAMLICCCSAAVNWCLTGADAVVVSTTGRASNNSSLLIFIFLSLFLSYYYTCVYASRLYAEPACREVVVGIVEGADAGVDDVCLVYAVVG